jgi:hypothetical protein
MPDACALPSTGKSMGSKCVAAGRVVGVWDCDACDRVWEIHFERFLRWPEVKGRPFD